MINSIKTAVSSKKKKKRKTSARRLSYKKIFYAVLFLLVLVIGIPSLYRFVKNVIQYGIHTEARQRENIATFGVSLPLGYNIHGVDISHHQKAINWTDVAAINVNGNCIKFAFIKATEGITRQDIHFSRNWNNCKKAGLIRGAYHFYYPTRDAVKQAENFISEVTLTQGDLPPVLDIELSKGKSKTEIIKGVQEWCKTIENHYGVKPIIYTNPVFYDKYLKDDFEDYPLWIAHYYKEKPRMQHRDWIFWQHTDCAIISGIDKPVDMNVFNGDIDELLKLCIE